jgi:hypothetical protein
VQILNFEYNKVKNCYFQSIKNCPSMPGQTYFQSIKNCPSMPGQTNLIIISPEGAGRTSILKLINAILNKGYDSHFCSYIDARSEWYGLSSEEIEDGERIDNFQKWSDEQDFTKYLNLVSEMILWPASAAFPFHLFVLKMEAKMHSSIHWFLSAALHICHKSNLLPFIVFIISVILTFLACFNTSVSNKIWKIKDHSSFQYFIF